MFANVLFHAEAGVVLQTLTDVEDPILPKIGEHYFDGVGCRFTVRDITYSYSRKADGWIVEITVLCRKSFVNTDPQRV